MRKIFLILFLAIGYLSFSQGQPTALPTLYNGKLYQYTQYLAVDSGLFSPRRDTNFIPKQGGCVVFKTSDSTLYVSTGRLTGRKWKGIGSGGGTGVYNAGYGMLLIAGNFSVDTTLISTVAYSQGLYNILNSVKLNITDTSSMLIPYLRKADTTAMLSKYLRKYNNLSDVSSVSISRNNLDVYSKSEIDNRTVQINVKNYGAVGDSLTDDYSAIQNAIDGGFKLIYFPAGHYRISSTLILRNNVTLIGAGIDNTIIDLVTNSTGFTVGDVTGSKILELRNLTIQRSGTGASLAGAIEAERGCISLSGSTTMITLINVGLKDANWNITGDTNKDKVTAILSTGADVNATGLVINMSFGEGYYQPLNGRGGKFNFYGDITTAGKCVKMHIGRFVGYGRMWSYNTSSIAAWSNSDNSTGEFHGLIKRTGSSSVTGIYASSSTAINISHYGNIESDGTGVQTQGGKISCYGDWTATTLGAALSGSGVLKHKGGFIGATGYILEDVSTLYKDGNDDASNVNIYISETAKAYMSGTYVSTGAFADISGGELYLNSLRYSALYDFCVFTGSTVKLLQCNNVSVGIFGSNASRFCFNFGTSTTNTVTLLNSYFFQGNPVAAFTSTSAGNMQTITGNFASNYPTGADIVFSSNLVSLTTGFFGLGGNPTSGFHNFYSTALAIEVVTTSQTLSSTQGTLLANTTSGGIVLTLPTSGIQGRIYTIKKTDASGNTVTVAGTIDGITNYVISAQNKFVTVQWDATGGWNIIGQN